jgi:hypothetical protein
MTFPHVAFRPIAGNSDIVPFSGVWLLRNSNQALRRFHQPRPHDVKELESAQGLLSGKPR